jgi:capsular exopolysaccharide synthesis family protein
VRRRKIFILVVLLLGSAAGFTLGKAVAPTYLVEGRIWIDNPSGRANAFGPIQSSQLLEATAWQELLRSYRVLDDAVLSLRLYLDVEPGADSVLFQSFGIAEDVQPGAYVLHVDEQGGRFTLARQERAAEEVDSGQVGDSIGARLGFLWAPPAQLLAPGQEVRFTVQTVRDASRRLSASIVSQMDEKGNFLRVTFRGTDPGLLPQRPPDPAMLAATLNAVMHGVVAVAGELKRSTLSERTQILGEQLAAAQSQLQEADGALESFRVRTITLPGGGGSEAGASSSGGNSTEPIVENFLELQMERERLRGVGEVILGALAGGDVGTFPVEGLESIGLVRESADLTKLIDELITKRSDLRALLVRYTEDSPPVAALRSEITTLEKEALPARARELLQEVRRREAALDGEIASQTTSLRRIPPRILEEGRLERNAALNQELYTTLRQRYEEARLAEVSSIPDLRILDEAAVPRVPEDAPGSKVVLMAFMGSLGVALMGAIVLDRVDHRVRRPSQITQGMGLSVLGAIPWMKTGRARGRATSEALVTEAFRSLRLNLDHAYGATSPVIVAVTSSDVGDGKSFVCANLARAFARQGRRTVVVDGDTRRGTQHELFKLSRKPGLTDYLHGTVPMDGLVQHVQGTTLGFIPAGTRRGDSPERLGSPRMMELLAHLKSVYQVIVVDTPPIGAGADAFALGTIAGSLLFVLRTGATNLGAAEANLGALDKLPVRVLGAVLNDIPVGEQAFRHYGYLSSYQIEDEEEAGPALLGPMSSGKR